VAKFVMLGKYSVDSVKQISPERTTKVISVIEGNGGKVEGMYVLLGGYDLCFLVDLPGTEQAVKSSVEIAKLTGISFNTFPAISVEEFDKLVA